MRLLPLYDVATLAGLALASPTPPTGAREVGDIKRLVLYSQDDFKGTPHEIEATNRCVKLEAPVYRNLHSYGVVDQVCYFLDTDRCNGKVVVTADAQGTRVQVDKLSADAGRVAAVYCGKQAAVDAGEVKDFAGAREAKDFAGAREVVDAVGAREVKNVVGRREAKDFAGAREVNEFTGAREVKNVVGRREAKDFAGAREAKDFAGAREVKNIVGRREVTDFTGGREVNEVVDAREVKNFAVKRKEGVIIDEDNFGPGDIYMCDDTGLEGNCETIYTGNGCVPFPAGLAHNFRSIYQAKGAICHYYGSNCDPKTYAWDLESKQRSAILHLDLIFAAEVEAVKCFTMWTLDSVDPTTSPTEKRAVSAKGDVRACKGSTCSSVQALNSCKSFSDDVAKQIDSLSQTAGSTCEYWANKDCSRLILTSISGSQDYKPDLGPGNRDGQEISAVSCKASRFAEASEGGQTIHASHDIEARSSSSTPCDDPNNSRPGVQKFPGFLYFCATANNDPSLKRPEDCENYRTCMELEAMDRCVSLKHPSQMFPLFDSLWQAQGAVCKYYRSSCKDSWPLLIVDSRDKPLPPIDYKKLPFPSAIAEAQCYHDTIPADLGAGPDTIVVNSIDSLRAAYGDHASLEGKTITH